MIILIIMFMFMSVFMFTFMHLPLYMLLLVLGLFTLKVNQGVTVLRQHIERLYLGVLVDVFI